MTVPVPETSPLPPAECKSEKEPCSISSQFLRHDHMGRFFLDIFAGASMPVSSAVAQFSADRFEPLDIIHGHDLLDDDIYDGAMQLASSGLIGAGLAAPYCCHHSRAKLKKPGPKPLRTPAFPDGVPENSWEEQLAVQESSQIHDRARRLLGCVARSGGIIILENPPSSMTWDDEAMSQWVHQVAPHASQAFACRFGADWRKAWMFVCNDESIEQVAKSCNHPPGSHQPIAGVKLPDGSYLSRLTAEYPQQLAETLAQVIKPFVTHGGRHVKLSEWRTLLPPKIEWPLTQARIEDGGGVTSSALQRQLPARDPLAQLRSRWYARLCKSKDCLKISQALREGVECDPLSTAELAPYLQDLLQALDDPLVVDQAALLEVVPGQPFRLSLWERIASLCNDPDVKFFELLKVGVPLGVNSTLDPAPCWPFQDGQVDEPVPLQACESSWKSARDHPTMVRNVLACQ